MKVSQGVREAAIVLRLVADVEGEELFIRGILEHELLLEPCAAGAAPEGLNHFGDERVFSDGNGLVLADEAVAEVDEVLEVFALEHGDGGRGEEWNRSRAS